MGLVLRRITALLMVVSYKAAMNPEMPMKPVIAYMNIVERSFFGTFMKSLPEYLRNEYSKSTFARLYQYMISKEPIII